MLRSYLDQLRAAVEGFDEMLASMSVLELLGDPLDSGRTWEAAHTFHCANGHADVIHLTPDCPVCAMKRLAGYSEKWCDVCREVTAHVGGLHVHASCVRCLSNRQGLQPGLAQAPSSGGPSRG